MQLRWQHCADMLCGVMQATRPRKVKCDPCAWPRRSHRSLIPKAREDRELEGRYAGTKKTMDLTFQVPLGKPRNSEQRRPFRVGRSRIIKSTLRSVQNLKGIGPKTAGALAAVNIHNVKQLVEKYRSCGDDWLKNVLPYGARFKIIKESLVNP